MGSRIGTFSKKIIRDLPNSNITLTDVSWHYVKQLEQQFCNSNNRVSSCKLDLNCKEDYEKIGYEEFDSIIAINVLEHVEHDEFALQQLCELPPVIDRMASLVEKNRVLGWFTGFPLSLRVRGIPLSPCFSFTEASGCPLPPGL